VTTNPEPETKSDPPQSVTQHELARLLKSQGHSLESLKKKLAELPGVTERLLDHLNSPEMGLLHKVKTLDHALALLGPDRSLEILRQRYRLDPAQKGVRSQIGNLGKLRGRP